MLILDVVGPITPYCTDNLSYRASAVFYFLLSFSKNFDCITVVFLYETAKKPNSLNIKLNS